MIKTAKLTYKHDRAELPLPPPQESFSVIVRLRRSLLLEPVTHHKPRAVLAHEGCGGFNGKRSKEKQRRSDRLQLLGVPTVSVLVLVIK